jgi:hypothetical protein
MLPQTTTKRDEIPDSGWALAKPLNETTRFVSTFYADVTRFL